MENNQIKSVSDYIKMYKKMNRKETKHKLPFRFRSEEDVQRRLTALYMIEVEKDGGQAILDEYTYEMIAGVARWLVLSPKRGLIIMGTPGNGKTTILRCICTIIHPFALMADAQDLVDYLKRQPEAMRHCDENVLIIDDLGDETSKAMNYGEASFPTARLLLHRYNYHLTTIFATNLDIDELKEKYGDRVEDRLYEEYEVVFNPGPSYRRR